MTHSPNYRTVWQVWLWLSTLTLLAAWLTDLSLPRHLLPIAALVAAWLKGQAIIEHFMGLKSAPGWLRWLVHGWLGGLTVLLSLSFI